MYILVLVSAMLMLLNIMTATRFASFLDGERVRLSYERYMHDRERAYINKVERKEYDDKRPPKATTTKVKEPKPVPNAMGKVPEKKKGEEKDKSNSVSKLNIYPLLGEKLAAGQQLWVDGTERLLVEIMRSGYGDQKFYQAAGTDPLAVAHHLIEEFINGAKKGACDVKIETVTDIANISFQQPDDRRLFYLMLKGAVPPKGSKETGYPTLYDFITYKKSDKITPIQVAKASDELLRAIFSGSPDVVERIVEARDSLKERLDKEELTVTQASQLLQQAAGGILENPNVPPEMLDFTVPEKGD